MASAQPSSVATAICAIAPGMAMARTDSRSFSEKCMPTPNISRMTPISASSGASDWSATKPGVNGPIDDAGGEIADERRDAQPVGERAEDEGQRDAGDDGGDERRRVRHGGLNAGCMRAPASTSPASRPRRMRSLPDASDLSEPPLLLPVGVEILGSEPALHARPDARPVLVGHGEPGRVAVLALHHHVLAKNALEAEAEAERGAPRRLVQRVALPFEAAVAERRRRRRRAKR